MRGEAASSARALTRRCDGRGTRSRRGSSWRGFLNGLAPPLGARMETKLGPGGYEVSVIP